jgi:hypothetical protein
VNRTEAWVAGGRPPLEVGQVVGRLELRPPAGVFVLQHPTDRLAEFGQSGVDPRDGLPGVQVGVEVPLRPVLGDARRVVPDPVGEIVPV